MQVLLCQRPNYFEEDLKKNLITDISKYHKTFYEANFPKRRIIIKSLEKFSNKMTKNEIVFI